MKTNHDTPIQASWRGSSEAGSCNHCSRYAMPHGHNPHIVLDIRLATCSFRLCSICVGDLMAQIKQLEKRT